MSVSVILFSFLLLAISVLIQQNDANEIIAVPKRTNDSNRNIEEFIVLFKNPNAKKPSVTNRSKFSISENDWNAVYQQACNDLSADELESLQF